jgi:NAD(P)-dependent dehydrogenase (short-subunit alcohol dehydrogenase family)
VNLLAGAAELTGRVVIVTGGAIGIGRAIAEDLGCAGARVVVADRACAAETAAELRDAGIDALGLPVDVSSEAATRELAVEVVRAYGGIDILVNNAGIFTTLRPGPLEEIDVAEWQRVMDVNVLGSYLCIRAVVGPMRDRGGGRIVNIASTTAFKGVSHLLHYVASKGAVIAMTRATARELGEDNILVNAVAPGFTVSDGILDGGADLAGCWPASSVLGTWSGRCASWPARCRVSSPARPSWSTAARSSTETGVRACPGTRRIRNRSAIQNYTSGSSATRNPFVMYEQLRGKDPLPIPIL